VYSYGVEPASYYIKNLALNWNLVFVFGALGPLFAVLVLTFTPGKRRAAVAFLRWVSGAMLWAAIMFSQPHKEERFLYPIYHLLSLSAVYCLCEFGALLGGETQSVSIDAPAVVKSDKKAIKGDVDEQFNKFSSGRVQKQSERGVCFCLGVLIRTALLVAFVALSVSRNIAQVVNYGAPLHVWGAVAAAQTKISLGLQDTPIIANSSVCVGKEWYRFPSSFFLPHGRLLFLRSEFRGQLPQPFPAPIDGRPATFVEQSEFNDENTEVMSRYSELDQCDYIVDLDLTAQREEHFARNPNFRVVVHLTIQPLFSPLLSTDSLDWFLLQFKYPFLDASLSPQLTRAFWIPTMSSERNIMRPYQLLERVPRAPESAAQQD
jgi:alpha-1,2-mannosyltransferase